MAPHWNFTNNYPSYSSMGLASIFFMLVHFTCIGMLRVDVNLGGVF